MGEAPDAIALLERAERTLDDVGDRRLIYFARDIKAHAFLRLGGDHPSVTVGGAELPVSRRCLPALRERLESATIRPRA